jgi:hypothetical protein
MSSSDTSLSIFVDEFVLDILYHLSRPRLLRDRSNPLEEFDDLNFKCRFM